ncbi:MAG: phytanoyl-CoA dioxygenase family protein [Flavobacteriales bacterium]|nr:phytanoyl-CoA dioxygenase family protein [Flavobacteriales bacterium]
MERAHYSIDNSPITVDMKGTPELKRGNNEVLSNATTDITHGLPWYPQGYHAYDFLSAQEFGTLRSGLNESIAAIVNDLGISSAGFDLEQYHKVVTTTEDHHRVAARTRDLFATDFNFSVEELVPRFEKLVGFGLTDVNPDNGQKMHIIVRINRPGSNDFNPPHKDMYGPWDRERKMLRFVNLWIPVAGVGPKSTLPVVPGSHLLPENKILRTFEGAVVEGNKYRVNAIVEWDGSSALVRPEVKYGQVLMFSAHLVHGLAKNEQEDTTRVALEFRLFRKD